MRFFFLISLLLAVWMSAARACICTADYTPVCATNGITYSNACRMGCEGASLRHKGECGRRY